MRIEQKLRIGKELIMGALEKHEAKWGKKRDVLKSIGIEPFGFDPGIIARIDGVTVDIPCVLLDIICDIVKERDDLLAAYKPILVWWEDAQYKTESIGDGDEDNIFGEDESDLFKSLQVAIKKAKGTK